MPLEPLRFVRQSGQLSGNASLTERVAAQLMAAGVRATRPAHYRGLSLGCRAISTGLRERDVIVQLADDALFSFRFGDGYWAPLLAPEAPYEPEVEALLSTAADADYFFVDGGANFGFWSVLATSHAYGGHPGLAIEPARSTFDRLSRNAALNFNRFAVVQAALGADDGTTATLFGDRHEARSIAGPAAHDAAPGKAANRETVDVVSLDGLATRGRVPRNRPLVVKLDVEGVEVEALRGATMLRTADAAIVCEDHALDDSHRVSRFLLTETPWSVFAFERKQRRFVRVLDLGQLARLKAVSPKGFNVFAATTPFWAERFTAYGRS